MWPELKIVHGKPRHSQSQGSVERANQDVENMLTTWMQQNDTNKWSKGLQFVQFMKNCAYHSGIKRTPYNAMFGVDPKVGLSTSYLPKEIVSSLEDEEDLRKVLQNIEKETEKPSTEENVTEKILKEKEDLQETEGEKCVICLNNCSEGDPSCIGCFKPVHAICSINLVNDDVAETCEKWQSLLCHRKTTIVRERSEAKESLCQQAKNMRMTSDKRHPSAFIGSTVRIKVPDVDHGRGDPRSVLAVVLDVTEDNFYKLGTRNGIIKQLYTRSEFSVCDEKLIFLEEIPSDKEVSLRTVATAQSTGTGQGFAKCNSTRKCETNKCACRKKNLLCNSKCHKSSPCTNK